MRTELPDALGALDAYTSNKALRRPQATTIGRFADGSGDDAMTAVEQILRRYARNP